MAKGKGERAKDLIAELIRHELEAQLSKLVRRAKRKANREVGKLNNVLRLEYNKDEGFIEAEYSNPYPDEGIKKEKMEAGARGFDDGIINHGWLAFGFVFDFERAGVGGAKAHPIFTRPPPPL